MSARNYHLRAASAATANAITSCPIIRAGSVKSVALSLYNENAASATIAVWELSTVPSCQSNTSEAQGILANGTISNEIGILESMPIIIPCDYPVRVGDKLYLHVLFVTGTSTQVGIANIAVAESGG